MFKLADLELILYIIVCKTILQKNLESLNIHK